MQEMRRVHNYERIHRATRAAACLVNGHRVAIAAHEIDEPRTEPFDPGRFMHDDVKTRVTDAQRIRQRISALRQIPTGLRQIHVEHAYSLACESDERVDRGNLLRNGFETLFARCDLVRWRVDWLTQRSGRIHIDTIG